MRILIEGELTKEELRELLQRVRDLEQREPARTVMVFVDAPACKEEEMLEVLRSIRPPMPNVRILRR
jgi:hypothetical protein